MNRYDEVPYSFHPFPQSHPDRLALVAKLFGLAPKHIGRCRVLELGCGRGGNLLPMAEQLPDSEFMGVELSEVQSNEAKQLASQARLANVDVRHLNILDVDDSMGKFDYIITHGVYSWVPKIVQERILEICSRNLADSGIAYVSYNVNPGWNMRGMLRDMMCYHASRFDTPSQRIQQARSLLDFVASNASDKTPYGMFLQSEVNLLRKQGDEYLYHEHLSDVNDPIYFYEFAQRCESANLQYIGESDVSGMFLGHFSNEVVSTVERVASDFVQMEQYFDFLRNRMFRQSLLTHRGVTIDRELKPRNLHGLYLSTSFRLENDQPIESPKPDVIRLPGGDSNVSIQHPYLKAVLRLLIKGAPTNIEYDQLLIEARKLIDKRTLVPREQFEAENAELGRMILKLFVNYVLEFRTTAVPFVTSPSAKPIASRLARVQAASGNLVTTLAHHRVGLNEFDRRVLQCLDGNFDQAGICDSISDYFQTTFVQESDSDKVTKLPVAVQESLSRFAQMGLLSH